MEYTGVTQAWPVGLVKLSRDDDSPSEYIVKGTASTINVIVAQPLTWQVVLFAAQ